MDNYGEKPITECSFVKVQKIVTGKWNMVIIYLLSKGTLRFGELHKKLPGVTQATLVKQLKELEVYGIVDRNVYNQVPPKVEYSLTQIGFKVLPVLEVLEKWSIEYEQYEKLNNE